MAVKRKRKMRYRRLPVAIEHTGFYSYLLAYNEAMRIRQYSELTLHRRESDIRRFIGWCDERSITYPQDVTKPILERYQRYLYYYRQANGEPLTSSSQNHYTVSVRQFFKWLTQQNHLLYNPASELIVPKQAPTLPVVLTEEEIDALLQQPDLNTPYGIRDRVILELFYSCGMRRSELCGLKVHDLSVSRRTVHIRQGKGGKERLIPVGERAMRWLTRYLNEVRNELLMDVQEQSLFLSDYGEPFADSKLGDRIKRYMKNAGITAPGSCHLLRHAMATHMLENGAEMRFIQAMLGHSDYRSTQMYTHVSIRKLQEIHAATHPAKVQRTTESPTAKECEEDDAAELLAVLAAESALELEREDS